MIPRAHADFWWEIMAARNNKPYGYGGRWDRDNINITTDCSGLVSNCLEAMVRGPEGFDWDREPYSTESWRVVPVGGVGPFGTICVEQPEDIPEDAAVAVGCQHGGGGPYSHMACTVFDPDLGHINVESAGNPRGQRMGPKARGYNDPLFEDWHYLPGPIESENWSSILGELTGEEQAMATADDVARKLVDDGDKIALYEGADWPGGTLTTGDARTWWNRLAWDLLRVQDGADHNRNGDGKSGRLGLRDGVKRIVFETTLWSPRLPLSALIAKRGQRDTLHGHARDAASFGDVSIKILRRIAEKLEVDIDDLLT